MVFEFDDEVYGHFAIEDDMLVDLLNSRAVQRLRGISQAGAASLIRAGRSNTRYDHSVGVMVLTKILGGSAVEQAAGLIQDASHTAFSHTVDHLYGDREEEFHERIFPLVMARGDIPTVLERYGLTWHHLFSAENLGRVDAPAPLLCADRIDYTLRDLLRFGYITTTDAVDFVDRLCYLDGVVAVRDVKSAAMFAEWYRYLVLDLYMHPLELYADDELARILRHGLEHGVLVADDMLLTDSEVLEKVRADDVHGLSAQLAVLESTSAAAEGAGPGSRRVYSKPRVVDPRVLVGGTVVPLSHLGGYCIDWSSIIARATGGVEVRRTG
ncbi:hypothetical protein V6V47_16015 [Micromonospora sp. CPCC 205539]|uniref:hypothetical protein n=1 Tax=Micromonospora sp. CPCC 205539 TaxID=3122408 RepID=UPI002FF3D7A2